MSRYVESSDAAARRRRGSWSTLPVLVTSAVALTCGGRTTLDVAPGNDPPMAVGTGGRPNESDVADASAGGTPSENERCIDLLTVEGIIYRLATSQLDEPEPELVRLGQVDCVARPNTMAVSDDGTGYVGTMLGGFVPIDQGTGHCRQAAHPLAPEVQDEISLGLLRNPNGSEVLWARYDDYLYRVEPSDDGSCCFATIREHLPNDVGHWRPELVDSSDDTFYVFGVDHLASQGIVTHLESLEALSFRVEWSVGSTWDAVHFDQQIVAFVANGDSSAVYVVSTAPLRYEREATTLSLAVAGAGLAHCNWVTGGGR